MNNIQQDIERKSLRSVANYPDEEMEIVFLKIMGIENDPKAIDEQKKIAFESNVDWLIHLREVSEEIQLYYEIGIMKTIKKNA